MVARNFEPVFTIPDKLQRRERVMRRKNGENEKSQQSESTSSFVISKDGSLIPVYDRESLEIIERNNTPEHG